MNNGSFNQFRFVKSPATYFLKLDTVFAGLYKHAKCGGDLDTDL